MSIESDQSSCETLGGHRTAVLRSGSVVVRETGPWASTVHFLLRHLEKVGFAASPRVVGTGFDEQGRETLTFIPGEFTQPGPWSMEGAAAVGEMIRKLHDATASFSLPPCARWNSWFGRDLGGPSKVIGHCDTGPWNIVARNGLPVGLIDWEFAGPVDPIVELAQACWLNAKLHDDIVAELEGLPPLAVRAHQVRSILEGYGLPLKQRRGFIELIIALVIHDTAAQADDVGVTINNDPVPAWGMAWRARSAAWIYRYRSFLQNAIS